MKTVASLTALAATVFALAAAPAAYAQPAAKGGPPGGDGGHAKVLAIKQVPATAGAKLTVTSPAFKDGADIPFENTQYRGNIFPGVNWSKGPKGTQSYVVVMQGTLGNGDDLSHGTSIHFILYDIPASSTKLDAGLTTPPAGAAYGSNVHSFKDSYAGPHTHNFTKHSYHLQVLALDTVVAVNPKMTLADLTKLMDGHVLASGEVVGLAAMDPDSAEGKEFIEKGGAHPAAKQ
jgi:para-nitrobenzyl esterase